MDLYLILDNINSSKDLQFIIIRCIVIYLFAIFLLRVGNKRFHLSTTFDFIFVIIIGSILSRAINGSSTLMGGIVSSVTLIIVHWILSVLCWYSEVLNHFIKGECSILIKNGKINWPNLKSNQITKDDLRERCRVELHHDNLKNIKEARLEKTGTITFKNK